MRLGHFEVNIRGRHERSGGYVALGHDETYTLELINHFSDRRAEATVAIDGKEVGTWRLGKSQRFHLERPANEAKQFTFYLDGTEQSYEAGITAGDSENGHIAVTFVAEKKHRIDFEHFSFSSRSAPSRGRQQSMKCASGATGLSGHSDQTFRTVSGLDKDTSTTTIIHLRLVGHGDISPLQCVHNKPPLSNSIPIPVRYHS